MLFLYVDDATEFLDPVEEQISLLDGVLILLVLAVGSIRLHNSVDFVDFRVESTSRDEPGKWICRGELTDVCVHDYIITGTYILRITSFIIVISINIDLASSLSMKSGETPNALAM